jgi:hypothetical protein
MIGEILDLPMRFAYWLSGQIRGFIASRQVSTPQPEEGAVSKQPATPASSTNLLDLPMVTVYWLSGRMRSWWAQRQNRTEVVVMEEEPEGPSADTSPRQEGGNPLRFRPDLWDLEGDDRMAMDVRPEIIVLPKPWGLLLWPTGRKVVGITLIEVFSLRMWINVETKTLWMSTSWVRGTIGNSYGVELIEIQVPEQVKYPGIFPEVLLNLSGVQFSIKGSGATKTEMRVVPLPRRGMWWPENIHRPRKGAKSRAGAAYVLAFKSLSKWANTGQWT